MELAVQCLVYSGPTTHASTNAKANCFFRPGVAKKVSQCYVSSGKKCSPVLRKSLIKPGGVHKGKIEPHLLFLTLTRQEEDLFSFCCLDLYDEKKHKTFLGISCLLGDLMRRT